MKVQKIVAAVAAASLAFGSAGSFAQSYIEKDLQDQAIRAKEAREYADQQRAAQRYQQRDGRPDSRDARGNDQRRDPRVNNGQYSDRNGYRSDNPGYQRQEQPGYGRRDRGDDRRSGWNGRGEASDYGTNSYYRRQGRGAGPDHSFYRGDRLPPQYRSPQYVVDDWRGHRLSQPPRGYHWVQAGGDYVLAAIATGLIVSILLNQ